MRNNSHVHWLWKPKSLWWRHYYNNYIFLYCKTNKTCSVHCIVVSTLHVLTIWQLWQLWQFLIWALKSKWSLHYCATTYKDLRHFVMKSEIKPIPTCLHKYLHILHCLCVFSMSFDWFSGLSVPFMIGHSDNLLGFLNCKLLYIREM